MSGYISKDFVHRGCGLLLKPEEVWEEIPYSVQKNIKKAQTNNVKIEKVSGTQSDIEVLKSMWYDPEDPNMPNRLSDNEFMFIAYNTRNIPVGAVILLPVGNHLFLNNLAGNEEGKALRVQDYLLWHCVNYFEDSNFKYIDVGVSYRQTLYDFFRKWRTISYPVIFNVPKYGYDIALNPFNLNHYNSEINEDNIKRSQKLLTSILKGKKFTFVPDMDEAGKIMTRLGYEFAENTFNFTDSSSEKPYAVDLTKLFSVQFGVLIVNLSIDDKSLWNQHRALDPFKRDLIYTNITGELEELNVLIALRKRNIDTLDNYFELEGIKSHRKDEIIPSAYYFINDFNSRYHTKLQEFGISHYFDRVSNEIGLPVHQNLSKFQFEYLYAIFRGVLNLCSEWVHTDVYSDLS